MPLTLGGWHKWGCDARQHPRATVCYGEGAPARGGEPVRRRAFISLLGGVAATWPLAAHPQQAGKLPTIGFLGASTPSACSQWTAAFVKRQRKIGCTSWRTVPCGPREAIALT